MFIAVYWLYYAFLTTYSWYVQHVLPKKEICCFLFYAEVHTQEKLHWSSCTFISHVDLHLHRSDKNNTKNHSPFLNCTVKAKNKCYLLKCYTFRCFGNAHKLYSYVTERFLIYSDTKPANWQFKNCQALYFMQMGYSMPFSFGTIST